MQEKILDQSGTDPRGKWQIQHPRAMSHLTYVSLTFTVSSQQCSSQIESALCIVLRDAGLYPGKKNTVVKNLFVQKVDEKYGLEEI
jgi:hypothetical protein